jgi:HlyD family secretion protein
MLAQIPGTAPRVSDNVRPYMLAGVVAAVVLVGGFGGWAATSELSGAVIAQGTVVVESNVKKVQHSTGGIVGGVHARNGNAVTAGDVLLSLDDTQTRAGLGIVVSQLIELTGRKARLIAERDGASEPEFPVAFMTMSLDADRIAAGERRLFDARRETVAGQKAQHAERTAQLRHEIRGLSSQREAKGRELVLVREELTRVTQMHDRNLLPVTRLLAMQREEARIHGEHGALEAQIARATGQIGEIELQILAIDQTLQTEAQKELREIEARVAELSERRIAAEDQLKRVDLRAPISGIVHELNVHTVGGVIGPGETAMLIVPDDDRLVIEVRASPADIDQIRQGQSTMLRFPAFNLRITPEIPGRVSRVAADLTRDPHTGLAYFLVRIRPDEEALAKLGGLKLLPGMPVEAYVENGQRTALSYLLKPLTDQFARAFKER